MTTLRVIGIGEWQVSRDRGDALRTYALGSCVGLVLHHPPTTTVGLVHILLPDSVNQPGGQRKSPGYYVDTAVPLLLRAVLHAAGIHSPAAGSGVVAKLAGGATMGGLPFRVGERNIEAAERLLRQYGIPLVGRDTGGTAARTVTVEVASGAMVVKWVPGPSEVHL